MEKQFEENMQALKESLSKMASLVECSIANAIEALIKRNSTLAEEVIEMDEQINKLEIDIDDACLKLLALHQPVAVDWRFITSAMKINNDLERIGDHAVNIAERAKVLNEHKPVKPLITLPQMAKIAQSMIKDSLDSFINGDVEKARDVCKRDDEVDNSDDQIFRELLTYIAEDPKTLSRAINLILVSKNIERIADLSTNIAEEVIFIYKAHIIKHHTGDTTEDIRSR